MSLSQKVNTFNLLFSNVDRQENHYNNTETAKNEGITKKTNQVQTKNFTRQ